MFTVPACELIGRAAGERARAGDAAAGQRQHAAISQGPHRAA